MGAKQDKCCCCPPCRVTGLCCPCVCKYICVTFRVPDGIATGCGCEIESIEIEYDVVTESWHSTLTCGTIVFDLEFYIKEEFGKCYWCLRSVALGYPLDDELCEELVDCEIDFVYDISTDQILAAGGNVDCAAGTLTVGCAEKIVPEDCTGCDCVCACVCMYLSSSGCSVDPQKVCYDETIKGWTATFDCGGGRTHTVNLIIGKNANGECILTGSIGGTDASGQVFLMDDCPNIDVVISGTRPGGGTVSVSISCVLCDDVCADLNCCPDGDPPCTLFLQLTTECGTFDTTLVASDGVDCTSQLYTSPPFTILYTYRHEEVIIDPSDPSQTTVICVTDSVCVPITVSIGMACIFIDEESAYSIIVSTPGGGGIISLWAARLFPTSCNPFLLQGFLDPFNHCELEASIVITE